MNLLGRGDIMGFHKIRVNKYESVYRVYILNRGPSMNRQVVFIEASDVKHAVSQIESITKQPFSVHNQSGTIKLYSNGKYL